MKINLEVDIAYAIDFLSILEVKSNKLKNQLSSDNFTNQKRYISSQINKFLFKEILSSQEYKDLYNTNEEIWNAIDLIKTNTISAKQVDDLNYKRWIIKNKLQSKFFNQITSEEKSDR